MLTGRPVRSCVCSTLKSFLSSDERVWITFVSTGSPVRSEELGSSQKELTSISCERDVFFFHLALYQVVPNSHELDLELVGSIGNFWIAVQLLHVERDLNLVLSSIRVSMRYLTEVEKTCILFRIRLLQFSFQKNLEYNKLEVFLEG